MGGLTVAEGTVLAASPMPRRPAAMMARMSMALAAVAPVRALMVGTLGVVLVTVVMLPRGRRPPFDERGRARFRRTGLFRRVGSVWERVGPGSAARPDHPHGLPGLDRLGAGDPAREVGSSMPTGVVVPRDNRVLFSGDEVLVLVTNYSDDDLRQVLVA